MPILYVMVGIPGSGKSYWATNFLNNSYNRVYVSRDNVRLGMLKEGEAYFSHEKAVFQQFVEEIVKYLKLGNDVIADATHNTKASRDKLINAIRAAGVADSDYEIIFVVMKTSLNKCIHRDNTRTGRAHVTESVIRDFFRWTSYPKQDDDYPNRKGIWMIYE